MDLKSANVLLFNLSGGDGESVKLTDFGLSQTLQAQYLSEEACGRGR